MINIPKKVSERKKEENPRVYADRTGDLRLDMLIESYVGTANSLKGLRLKLDQHFTCEEVKALNKHGEEDSQIYLVAKLDDLRKLGWKIDPSVKDIRVKYEHYIDTAIDLNRVEIDWHTFLMSKLIENATEKLNKNGGQLF